MHAKLFTLLVLLFIAGCTSVPSLLYKIDVQQGNVITREMVEKLKPGMTRAQVRFVLGSALIGDVFHKDRWDYVYRLEQQGVLIEEYKLTVFFEDDKLARTEGDFSDSFASVSPQLVEPVKYPTEVKQDTDFSPESVDPGTEQDKPTILTIEEKHDAKSSPEPTDPGMEQDKPTILAIEEKYDATSSPEPVDPGTEQVLPPPPPGIADGIEAD